MESKVDRKIVPYCWHRYEVQQPTLTMFGPPDLSYCQDCRVRRQQFQAEIRSFNSETKRFI
ncbi:hypothetical protein CUMW_070940 [Citrus unshiu]|nr:hypothetical protein CUMW_070940 [Citrus unshiu]